MKEGKKSNKKGTYVGKSKWLFTIQKQFKKYINLKYTIEIVHSLGED